MNVSDKPDEEVKLSPTVEARIRKLAVLRAGGWSPVIVPNLQALETLKELVREVGGIVFSFKLSARYLERDKNKPWNEAIWDDSGFFIVVEIKNRVKQGQNEEQALKAALRIRNLDENNPSIREAIDILRETKDPPMILLDPDPLIFMQEGFSSETASFFSGLHYSRDLIHRLTYPQTHLLLPFRSNEELGRLFTDFNPADYLSIRGITIE